MMGMPGWGLEAICGSIPSAVNSYPTIPVLMSTISAEATWSYIYNQNENVFNGNAQLMSIEMVSEVDKN